MSFAAAVDSLHALAQELAPGAPRRKFEIRHMRTLAAALGDPQKQFPSVLIAGTNGKGSTAATLASILTAAGLRTGLYTSPHLSRITERIRTSEPAACVNDLREISEEEFASLYFQVDSVANRLVESGELPHHPSYFESLTAIAFLYFADRHVELAVLEVGMGGRLDATNIVEPLVSVITDIALDHQEYLGNTVTEIAREKAGILRPNGVLVTLPQHPEANQEIGEAATSLNVRGVNAAAYLPGRELELRSRSSEAWTGHPNEYDLHVDGEVLHVRSPLIGEHQRRNIALAIATAVELRRHNPDEIGRPTPAVATRYENSYKLSERHEISHQSPFRIPNDAIEAGIANTRWPGRLELLPGTNLLLDVAHNPAGAWALRSAIAALPENQPRTLLFSCLRDKDLTEIARILFPLFDSTTPGAPAHHIVFAPIESPRAARVDDLLAAARALDIPAQAAGSAAEALEMARSVTPANGLIIATGSIYLVGALRELARGSKVYR